MKQAFDQSGGSRNLRNDLLVAADSVTSAMSSLVRELNSGKRSGEWEYSLVDGILGCSKVLGARLFRPFGMSIGGFPHPMCPICKIGCISEKLTKKNWVFFAIW